MKHLIAARSDKDKRFSFPHQGQANLSENRFFQMAHSFLCVTRVNSITGTKIKQMTWQRKILNDNLELKLLPIQDEKQVAETWFKRDPFPTGSTHHIPPPQVHILFYFHMEYVKKKPKTYNGSQSSIVTFKNKATMHCYASGKSTIEKKYKIPLSVMLWSFCWRLRTSWANAQYTHQHTWQLLLLLLRKENSPARFKSAWAWACWWDRGGISQRINACWAPPCPCKLIGAVLQPSVPLEKFPLILCPRHIALKVSCCLSTKISQSLHSCSLQDLWCWLQWNLSNISSPVMTLSFSERLHLDKTPTKISHTLERGLFCHLCSACSMLLTFLQSKGIAIFIYITFSIYFMMFI